MSKQDGGQAFPQPITVGPTDDLYPAYPGMTLRDWFAGQALLGILSGPASRQNVPATEWYDAPEHAYRLADAMLAEREKGETS